MPYRIAICDDEDRQLCYLSRLLKNWGTKRQCLLEINQYKSAQGFLFEYGEKPCDLLLLDIGMKGQSGMELAKLLRARGDKLPIVFITGFSEYMAEGYDVEALHYLLKPVKEEKLSEVLDRCIASRPYRGGILLRGAEGILHVAAEDILYVEAYGRKTLVRMADGSGYACDYGIKAFAERYAGGVGAGMPGSACSRDTASQQEQFVSCHRSYLANLCHIKAIRKAEIVLDNGEVIPLSRRMYEAVNKAFIRYYARE